MSYADPTYPAVATTQTGGWLFFTYVTFGLSLLMVLGGIAALPLDIWMRGYLAIGVLMVVQSCLNLSKTLRDNAESARLVHRVEAARTEKMLLNT